MIWRVLRAIGGIVLRIPGVAKLAKHHMKVTDKALMDAVLPEELRQLLETLANAECVGVTDTRPPNSATVTVGEITIYVHDMHDDEEEYERLMVLLEKVTGRVKMLGGRLANKNYTEKAPANIVQETRDQLEETQKEQATLKGQVEELDIYVKNKKCDALEQKLKGIEETIDFWEKK